MAHESVGVIRIDTRNFTVVDRLGIFRSKASDSSAEVWLGIRRLAVPSQSRRGLDTLVLDPKADDVHVTLDVLESSDDETIRTLDLVCTVPVTEIRFARWPHVPNLGRDSEEAQCPLNVT